MAAVVVIGVTVIIALAIVGLQLSLNAEAERKVMHVLSEHYRGHDVSVKRRIEGSQRRDYQFFYQVCFDVVLDGKARRTAMVQGDDDGGTFGFGGEYPSMHACEAHFFRG